MSLNFKNTIPCILIVCGFLLFLINAYELNSNYPNIKILETIKSLQNTSNIKDINIKTEVKTDDLIYNFSKNEKKLKNKKTIIIVKKGQTFLSILSNFNFKNKRKFEIINAINSVYNLRELKVNQKIIFFTDNKEDVKKILIELNFNTNLEVYLKSDIKIEIKELEIFSEIQSQ